MSIYNAIANAGAGAGQGITNYFAGKYQVDRDKMLDQEAQAQNAYVKQRDTMQIKQQALQEAARIAGSGDMDAAFGYLDQVGSQIGEPPADRQRLAPILQGMARTYQGGMGQNRPSSVEEWEYYNSLSPADQARFLDMKRAPATISLGGGGTGFANPVNPVPTPVVSPEVATGRDAVRAGAITGAQEGAEIAAIPARSVAQIRTEFDQAAAQSRIEGMADLPQARANAQSAISALQALRDHPGLDYIVGAAAVLPIVPGTPQADAFSYMEQIQGKAFLEAFATLKGGGQITEVEGAKATAAIARLNRAQSKQAFQQSINELLGIAESALERAEKKAGQDKPVQVQGVQTMPAEDDGWQTIDGGIRIREKK